MFFASFRTRSLATSIMNMMRVSCSLVPSSPNIQENLGVPAPVRTYQDLLGSAYDEALFDYYATSQLALVDASTGARTPVGRPAIFQTFAP